MGCSSTPCVVQETYALLEPLASIVSQASGFTSGETKPWRATMPLQGMGASVGPMDVPSQQLKSPVSAATCAPSIQSLYSHHVKMKKRMILFSCSFLLKQARGGVFKPLFTQRNEQRSILIPGHLHTNLFKMSHKNKASRNFILGVCQSRG